MSGTVRCVLDTHAALWAQLAPPRLGRGAIGLLNGLPPAEIGISDVTLTETARLLRDGRISVVAAKPEAWLTSFGLCYEVVPVTASSAWVAAGFNWSHRDPCDRQILATAAVLGVPLVTADATMTAFAASIGVTVVW